MSNTTIKPLRGTKSNVSISNKVLEKDEMIVITPDSGSGMGKYKLAFGDGTTALKNLPIAIDGENVDDMKLSAFQSISESNPTLSVGETVKELISKIKSKFTYLEGKYSNISTDISAMKNIVEVILVNTGWSSTAPYSQRVAVSGIKSTDNPKLLLNTPKTLSAENVKAIRKYTSMITDGDTEDGYVTFYCAEKKPDKTFSVKLEGVSTIK